MGNGEWIIWRMKRQRGNTMWLVPRKSNPLSDHDPSCTCKLITALTHGTWHIISSLQELTFDGEAHSTCDPAWHTAELAAFPPVSSASSAAPALPCALAAAQCCAVLVARRWSLSGRVVPAERVNSGHNNRVKTVCFSDPDTSLGGLITQV